MDTGITKEEKHDIVPTHLIIRAMRDNGYKNAAYAVSELMDNAIQAGATQVELLCSEEYMQLQQRSKLRLKQIAVLDNGSGMDAKILRMALQFGNGTRLNSEDHNGMGRFGMGLPNSSISQAKRVDVWSWTNGAENASHTYLDLEEFGENQITEVPEPQTKQIPQIWREVSTNFGESGTLVVWSNIDRCMWQTARALIDNSELLIGRIYRYFLNDGTVNIRLASFNGKNPKDSIVERVAVPNDPLYLMEQTSCPEPFNNKAMFDKWGEESTFNIEFRGEEYPVIIKFAVASQESRETINAGNLPHGKHAAKNIGVSIVRANRELDLDSTWTTPSDPRERWWGVEINFPPALDDLFGVTNNKQSARYFSYLATVHLELLVEDDANLNSILEEMSADEDMRLPILKIANHIKNQIASIRLLIDKQNKGQRTQKRYDVNTSDSILVDEEIGPEKKATEVIRDRQEAGHEGKSDAQELVSDEERKQILKESLIEDGLPEESAEQLAASLINTNLKVMFDHSDISSPAFFDIKSQGGVIFITLNNTHPAYNYLNEVLEEKIPYSDEEEECDEKVKELRGKFLYVRQGLKLLLTSWARYEDEAPDGKLKTQVKQVRWNWGNMTRDFFDE